MKAKCFKNRKGWIILLSLLLFISVILLLYHPTNKDTSFHEPDYVISFLIGDTKNRSWENVKKGAEMAANDYNVSLRFDTLDENNQPSMLNIFIEEEVKQDTQAMVVFPNPDLRESLLKQKIPVIQMKEQLTAKTTTPYIGCNYRDMGADLAVEIIRHGNYHKTVLLLQDDGESYSMQQLRDSFTKELESADNTVKIISTRALNSKSLQQEMEHSNTNLVASFSAATLKNVALYPLPMELYGVGNSTTILEQVENGNIKSVVIQDDFSIGYLSVVKAVSLIDHKEFPYHDDIRYSMIDKERIYSKDNEKLIFPFNR